MESTSNDTEPAKIAVCGLTGADRNFIANCLVGEELLKDNENDGILTPRKYEDEYNGVSIEVASIEAYDIDRHNLDNYKDTLKDLRDEVFDIFIYCISVRAGKPDLDQDKIAFDELRQLLHPNTLDNCLIVLTYVDYIVTKAQTQYSTKKVTNRIEKEYTETIKRWATLLERNLGSKFPVVQAGSSQFFSVLDNDEYWQSVFYHKTLDIINNDDAETILVKRNLFRLTTKEKLNKKDILKRRYYEHPIVVGENSTKIKEKLAEILAGVSVGGVTGAVGATIGALIGALAIGIPSFGVAAGAGLVLGAAIGGSIGAGTGVTVTKAVSKRKKKKEEEKDEGLV